MQGGIGGLARRHPNALRVGIIGGVALGGVSFLMMHTARQAPPHQPPPITMVMIQPPKPPPPPPPLPQPKLITPPKMTTPVEKPLIPNTPPKPTAAKPPGPTPMGTSIHNNGPADAFNLNGNPGGDGFGGGGGGGGSYGDSVSYEISQALQKNPKTRFLSTGLQIRIWVDAQGSITKVGLAKSSGSAAIDDAIVNQVLPHLHIDAPPSGIATTMLVSLVAQSPL